MATTNIERNEDPSSTTRSNQPWHRYNTFPVSIAEKREAAAMITHRAADDGASGIVVSNLPTATQPKLLQQEREEKQDSSVSSDENENRQSHHQSQHRRLQQQDLPPRQQQYKPESTRRKIIRRTLFAVVVLIGNTLLSAYLKRYGIISKDLHEVVSERLAPVAEQVMPEIQQRLELLELRMRDTLESVRFIAPGFNETLYWLRLNQTASQGSVSTQAKLRPGHQLAEKYGVQGKYPVVMVPGFVTSGLEVWKGKDCMEKFFRERVWGGFSSAQYWLRERYCVMENLALDPINGGRYLYIHIQSVQSLANIHSLCWLAHIFLC